VDVQRHLRVLHPHGLKHCRYRNGAKFKIHLQIFIDIPILIIIEGDDSLLWVLLAAPHILRKGKDDIFILKAVPFYDLVDLQCVSILTIVVVPHRGGKDKGLLSQDYSCEQQQNCQ
jgi:hypothetical protein